MDKEFQEFQIKSILEKIEKFTREGNSAMVEFWNRVLSNLQGGRK